MHELLLRPALPMFYKLIKLLKNISLTLKPHKTNDYEFYILKCKKSRFCTYLNYLLRPWVLGNLRGGFLLICTDIAKCSLNLTFHFSTTGPRQKKQNKKYPFLSHKVYMCFRKDAIDYIYHPLNEPRPK